MITQARLRELLSYDANTGIFTRIKSTGAAKAGAVAGSKHVGGYLAIRIGYKLYLAHRLAWLYVYGTWPANQLDHINGICDDNRIDNLREATSGENQQNRGVNTNNTSGFVGVSWEKRRCKWRAYIMHNKKTIHLGYFTLPEEAHAAYLHAKQNLHTYNPTIRSITNPIYQEVPEPHRALHDV